MNCNSNSMCGCGGSNWWWIILLILIIGCNGGSIFGSGCSCDNNCC